MHHFPTIEKLDHCILYALELASSLSVLLLAFGLIASMANVLTKGSVLTDSLYMQRIWAWTQCIAIDASVAGTIIRTFRYRAEGEVVKTWLYGLLSVLLLFTAAIVSNIESVQQTLDISLEKAYIHVFVPVEALIWIRSLAIVLLIVAHAMKHVHLTKRTETPSQPENTQPVITAELVENLRELLTQTTIREEVQESQQALPSPAVEQCPSPRTKLSDRTTCTRTPDNYERVKAYIASHKDASVREVAEALTIGISTANKWMQRVKAQGEQNKEREHSV